MIYPIAPRRWRVEGAVGRWAPTWRYPLGVYRWRWLAALRARLHLLRFPARTCFIEATAAALESRRS